MAYVALYREWRPRNFADIIGQNQISRTLQNALEGGRIAHAYLFCGPRGTGKTSTAKVLAKALNCLNREGSEPCNECENCRRINQGSSLDVLEIDAASNRGIDEIRDLREKVKFAPSEGKSKVYIIDEVHMLTNEAFNALLKTLEEPPSYVVFVLATTEPHKIPLTIMSRCQRFDFRRISLEDITERLRFVAGQAGLEITEEALFLIARTAEGGMRDALSILDQCVAFNGKNVDASTVHSVVGTVSSELIGQVLTAVAGGAVGDALKAVDVLSKGGKDLRQFLRDLIDVSRDLVLIQVCPDPSALVRTASDLAELKALSALFTRENLLDIIGIFTETDQGMRWTSQPRLALELGLIKAVGLVRPQGGGDLTEMTRRLGDLEDQIKKLVENQSAPPQKKPAAKASRPPSGEGPRPPVDLGPVDEPGLTEIRRIWPTVLETVKKQRRTAHAILLEAQPIHFANNCLTLEFNYPFHRQQVEQQANREVVETALDKLVGHTVRLRCILPEEIAGDAGGAAKQETIRETLVKEAEAVFDRELIELKD